MVNRVRKGYVSLIAAVMFLLAGAAGFLNCAGAEGYNYLVVDIEDVLTSEDEIAVNDLLAETSDKVGMKIGIIYSNDLMGMSAREYTEMFFDNEFGENSDGVMLLINGDFRSDGMDWLCGAGEHGEDYAKQSEEILSACYDGLNRGGFRGLAESYCEYLSGGGSDSDSVSGGYRAVLSDLDDKLTDAEETELLSLMQQTANSIECNVGVVITDNLMGKSDRRYADDFLDESFTFGSSSIVLLYNNDRSNMDYVDWISTCGRGSDLYDRRVDDIFDSVYDGLDPDDDYARSIKYFCSYLESHSFDTSGNYDTYGSISIDSDMFDRVTVMVVPMIVSLALSIIVAGSVAATYKKKKPISAAAYIDSNRTRFTRKTDIFVREFTTHHTISSSSGGGRHSGGGGHHSSSHHSHGGGGGRRR